MRRGCPRPHWLGGDGTYHTPGSDSGCKKILAYSAPTTRVVGTADETVVVAPIPRYITKKVVRANFTLKTKAVTTSKARLPLAWKHYSWKDGHRLTPSSTG